MSEAAVHISTTCGRLHYSCCGHPRTAGRHLCVPISQRNTVSPAQTSRHPCSAYWALQEVGSSQRWCRPAAAGTWHVLASMFYDCTIDQVWGRLKQPYASVHNLQKNARSTLPCTGLDSALTSELGLYVLQVVYKTRFPCSFAANSHLFPTAVTVQVEHRSLGVDTASKLSYLTGLGCQCM